MKEKMNIKTFYLPKELFEKMNDLQSKEIIRTNINNQRYLDYGIFVDTSEIEEYLPLIKTISIYDRTTKKVLLSTKVERGE